MTLVRARLNRADSYTFEDLTDSEVSTAIGVDGLLEVTLTPDVSDEVAAAVRCRVISQGPEDESIRMEIAGLLDQEPSEERTAGLVEALGRLAVLVP